MKPEDWLLLIAGGLVIPAICAFRVFVSHRHLYPRWVKFAVLTLCLAAFGWGGLDLVLLNRGRTLSRETRDRLTGFRGLLGGVAIGIVLTISFARPERKSAEAAPDTGDRVMDRAIDVRNAE